MTFYKKWGNTTIAKTRDSLYASNYITNFDKKKKKKNFGFIARYDYYISTLVWHIVTWFDS